MLADAADHSAAAKASASKARAPTTNNFVFGAAARPTTLNLLSDH